MKIKTKKQFTLPQLIEWAWDNPNLSNDMSFLSIGSESVKINFRFNPRGVLNLDVLNGNNISNDVLFTLETEEEITEDTRLDELVVRYRNGNIYIFQQERINDFKDNSNIIAFYIPNDDLTFTLIWTHEKGLVK